MSHPLARIATLTTVLLLGLPAPAEERENRLPDTIQVILDRAESIEVWSIDPQRREDKPRQEFHGWAVLGKTTIENKNAKKKVLEAIARGIADNKGEAAKCFDPRHAIRARHEGKSVDLLICFACMQIEVYVGDKKDRTVLTTRSPQPLLDKVLKDAGVTLAPKPKD